MKVRKSNKTETTVANSSGQRWKYNHQNCKENVRYIIHNCQIYLLPCLYTYVCFLAAVAVDAVVGPLQKLSKAAFSLHQPL